MYDVSRIVKHQKAMMVDRPTTYRASNKMSKFKKCHQVYIRQHSIERMPRLARQKVPCAREVASLFTYPWPVL